MKRSRNKALLLLPLFALLLAMLLACGFNSSPTSTVMELPKNPTAIPADIHAAYQQPGIPETRLLTLEFPQIIRVGDSDVVRLTLDVDENSNLTATASISEVVIHEQVIAIPNVYDTHNVIAEARLDMAGMDIRPSQLVSETLLPRQKITFYWSVLPGEAGKFKGTVWFYLRFVPKAGGNESREALSAQEIKIEATSFLGLKANQARWLGGAGVFLSSLVGLPFIKEIAKLLWRRIGRKG